MSKAFLAAFVLIALGAVMATDYVNQTHKADLSAGQMSLAAYAATIGGRLGMGEKPDKSAPPTVRALPGATVGANAKPAPLGAGTICSTIGNAKKCSLSGG